MKVALIGFGHAGRMHETAIRQLGNIELTAVCDPSAASREAAAALGANTYAMLGDMMAEDDFEAAIVCTPPREHLAAAVSCLQRGIHVLCEKPLACGSAEAVAMFQAADEHAKLAVASKFRHVGEIRQLRSMIGSGELGELRSFQIAFRGVVDMRARWNAEPELSGGGVIADNGSHVFDVARYLFGSLTRVRAIALPAIQALKVEDIAELQIETAAGVVGKADLSWSTPPSDDIYIRVQGSRYNVAIGWKKSLIQRGGGEWQAFGDPYDRNRAHSNMHAAFREAIHERAPLWITTEECLEAIAAVEASYRSIRSGATETISPASAGREYTRPNESSGAQVAQ